MKNDHYESGEKMFMKWINWGYSLPIFLGVICAFLTVCYFWKRYKYSWEFLQILVIITIPSSIIGAKLYTLIVDGGWSNWYSLQGLSIYGVIIFGVLSGSIFTYFRRHIVDFRTVASIVIPTILIGQALGRWGNFFNHEVYGKVVDGESLNWMGPLKKHMYILDKWGEEVDGLIRYRAPIFFYESMASLAGYILIVWVFNYKNIFKPGVTAGLYLIWYGVSRLVLQMYRADSQVSWIGGPDGISLNLVVSIVMISIGSILFVWFQLFTKPFGKVMKRILPNKFIDHFQQKYQIIYPVKTRRIFFVGPKTNEKGKYFLYFGPRVENKIKLYVPMENEEKWSKRELNKGRKNPKS